MRYTLVRTMMFRGDFLVWALVELFWMSVNVLMIVVIYRHASSIAGWSEYQMLLLVGTSMLIQRLLMGFFWTSLFDLGRNVRNGDFDFMMAQPGNPLFMASTRKLDPDSLVNSLLAMGLVFFAAHRLGLHPGVLTVALYAALVLCGLVIHYSILVITVSLVFWLRNAQGVEGSYFTLAEFGRLPREAFRGVSRVVFVWIVPLGVVSNVPARALLRGFNPGWVAAVALLAAAWFAAAVFIFGRGLRRYSSASS